MTSTIIQPIAAALKGVLEAIADAPPVYLYSPGMEGLDQVPCFVIFLPSVRRVAPEQAESQLGADDFRLTLPVAYYFDLDDARAAQAKAVEWAEAAIRAVDADPSLGGAVLDAKVSAAEPNYESTDEARPTLSYELEVECLALVDTA